MTYNVYASNGKPLPYPHATKFTQDEVLLITRPDALAVTGDALLCATEFTNPDGSGNMIYSNFFPPVMVVEVLEQRDANGTHKTDFTPIFQRCKVEKIN